MLQLKPRAAPDHAQTVLRHTFTFQLFNIAEPEQKVPWAGNDTL